MGNGRHTNNYNLLRFVFASLVIVSHAIEIKFGNRDNEILTRIFGTLSFGELAVDSFFILSGFLISKSWIERPDIAFYLKSRILRIYPGFIASSLLCTFIVGPLYSDSTYYDNLNFFRYIKSIVLLSEPSTNGLFLGSFHPVMNGSVWSIFIEFCCYTLLLIFGISKLLSKRYPWILLTVCVIAVYALDRLHILNTGWIYLYVRCTMFFCAGCCFYLYKDSLTWNKKYAISAAIAAALFMFNSIIAEIALAFFWGYSIIYFANNGSNFLNFNKLPDISYGIYLYAWPVNKVIYQEAPEINPYLCMVVTLALSICIATISWYAIERPFLSLKKKSFRPYLFSKGDMASSPDTPPSNR